MCFSYFFILVLIYVPVEAKNLCNDECLTKTYCISSDGSDVCSKNNLVTAQFKVIPNFGGYDYLQLTLKGYNVASDDEKTIKLSFNKSDAPPNVYTCYKSSLGLTDGKFDRDKYSLRIGSSYYMNGILYCNWIFNVYDTIWPQDVDMIKESSQSITLYHDSQKVVVAQDTSQLPIYHTQYLKCCNKVHGNDAFLLTFDQTEKQIRYQLYYWKYKSNKVTVTLKRKDGVQLHFICYAIVNGYINNGTKRLSLDQQLIKSNVDYDEICAWATPFVLGDSTIRIDASTSVFDLQVDAGSLTVYTEKDVVLKNSSNLVKLSFILIVFAVLLQIAIICS